MVGQCVSFSLAVPGAPLLNREMSNAISMALCTSKPIKAQMALKDGFSHWLILRTRDEHHLRKSLATDATASGWGGSVTLSDRVDEVSDYRGLIFPQTRRWPLIKFFFPFPAL